MAMMLPGNRWSAVKEYSPAGRTMFPQRASKGRVNLPSYSGVALMRFAGKVAPRSATPTDIANLKIRLDVTLVLHHGFSGKRRTLS
jgi:hypothetical protein